MAMPMVLSNKYEPPSFPQNKDADPAAIRNREAEGRLLRLTRMLAGGNYVSALQQAKEDLEWCRNAVK